MGLTVYTIDPKTTNVEYYFDELIRNIVFKQKSIENCCFLGKSNLLCENDFLINEDVLYNNPKNKVEKITFKLSQYFSRDNKRKFSNFFRKCQLDEMPLAVFSLDGDIVIIEKVDYFGELYVISSIYENGQLPMINKLEHRINFMKSKQLNN